MNLIKNTIFILFLFFLSISNATSDIVLLVPGFFNSFAPEYFSKDIQNSFTKAHFKTYVVNNLNPIGSIEDNGNRLNSFMHQIEKIENQPIRFHMITHSMGGFYSMWVAHRQQFNIATLFTISTPYEGVEFVQAWRKNSILFKIITDLAFFEGLKETTPEGINQFINSIRLNSSTKIFAFAGFQEEYLDITDSRTLPIPLRITSHFINGKSDGIVSYNSALAVGKIKTTQGLFSPQFRDNNFFINLDHMEQVLNYDSFLFLGIRNPEYIKNEQIRFYTALADFLKTIL